VSFSLIPLYDEEGNPRGTRLYIGNYHVHHYVFGIIFLIFGIVLTFLFPPLGMFFVGFGMFLIIDQIPNLTTGQWGLSITQSIVG
jgi:NADH:ubiquinone oxidoreductase subunit 3 (subunit A)